MVGSALHGPSPREARPWHGSSSAPQSICISKAGLHESLAWQPRVSGEPAPRWEQSSGPCLPVHPREALKPGDTRAAMALGPHLCPHWGVVVAGPHFSVQRAGAALVSSRYTRNGKERERRQMSREWRRAEGRVGEMSGCTCVCACYPLPFAGGEWIHRAACQADQSSHCTDGEAEARLVLEHAASGQNRAPESRCSAQDDTWPG